MPSQIIMAILTLSKRVEIAIFLLWYDIEQNYEQKKEKNKKM